MTKKTHLVTSIVAVGLVLFASATAFANNSHRVTLQHDVVLNGTQLQAGDYTIRWESHSAGATVTILKKKNAVVTAEAQLIDRGVKFHRDMVVYDENPAGTRTLKEIRLAGTGHVFVFSE